MSAIIGVTCPDKNERAGQISPNWWSHISVFYDVVEVKSYSLTGALRSQSFARDQLRGIFFMFQRVFHIVRLNPRNIAKTFISII